MKFAEFMKRVIKITIDNRGRIYLPKSLRNMLEIHKNDELFVILEDNCFCIYTPKGLDKKIQKLIL